MGPRAAFAAAIGLLIASPLAARPAGCADQWKIVLNDESFAHNGAGKSFSAARLAAFRSALEARLKAAISSACRQGKVKPGEAKKIRIVEVTSASGASEPTLYPRSRGKLALEWVFAEENLSVPSGKAILEGSSCWTNPRGSACLESGD